MTNYVIQNCDPEWDLLIDFCEMTNKIMRINRISNTVGKQDHQPHFSNGHEMSSRCSPIVL